MQTVLGLVHGVEAPRDLQWFHHVSWYLFLQLFAAADSLCEQIVCSVFIIMNAPVSFFVFCNIFKFCSQNQAVKLNPKIPHHSKSSDLSRWMQIITFF